MVDLDRFQEFEQAVFGYSPFPWQERLLRQVASEGQWPDIISLPTGAGKTAVIDVAVFSLSCGLPVPRRTVMVVDRRLVVDAAYDRARKIADALNEANADGVLADMALALKRLGGTRPLEVALLRGGMYGESLWASDPAQALVLCSTVDQVGSRLLHRGYGVSSSMRPIHAGLLGNDSLIILDEAHISEPFRQTLSAIKNFRRIAANPIPLPFSVVTMTATPSDSSQKVFRLEAEDYQNETLSKRLRSNKHLEMIAVPKARLDRTIAEAAIKNSSTGSTVLVVVNRVARARAVAAMIQATMKNKKGDAHVEVITGRSRPLDREGMIQKWACRLFSGRDRASMAEEPPLFIVATQAIEVGADIDADVLVSEACPIDSLRQRIGRLDRMGERGENTVVLVGDSDLEQKEPEKTKDPVYGHRTAHTWRWLRSLKTPLDLGASGWETIQRNLNPSLMENLTAPVRNAPVMFPAYCDLWVQTRPEPPVSPRPAHFLHGMETAEPEVQIVWRADLNEDDINSWTDTVGIIPPSAVEALSLPMSQARAWLKGQPNEDTSDLETALTEPELWRSKKDLLEPLPFVLWRGPGSSVVSTDPQDLLPGDTIVVPCSRGGLDSWGWAGADESNESASGPADLAEIARERSGRFPIIRLHPSLVPEAVSIPLIPSNEAETDVQLLREELERVLKNYANNETAIPESRQMAALIAAGSFDFSIHPSGNGWVVYGRKGQGGKLGPSNEDDQLDQSFAEVSLDKHQAGVAETCSHWASSLGIPEDLATDIRLAALLHDVGKADPRFQTMLWGGNPILAARSGLLAKSRRGAVGMAAQTALRRRAAYPSGARHELLSFRMMENLSKNHFSANDRDLVLHLVASHHGWCRPFAKAFQDDKPRMVFLRSSDYELEASSDCIRDGLSPAHYASGVGERFWRLIKKYGWWGLSYLEAILRLADHRVSEGEARKETAE